MIRYEKSDEPRAAVFKIGLCLVLAGLWGCGGDSFSKNKEGSFELLDKDGDGFVSYGEFGGAEREFRDLDRNQDGKLSAQEFSKRREISPDTKTSEVFSSDLGQEIAPSPKLCEERPLKEAGETFFEDISDASGIRQGNYDPHPTGSIPINDHSRLAFADLNGDGFDEAIMHSLFPNPQAGIPFEHLIFLNNKDGTFSDFSTESGLRDVQAGFFAFGDIDNDGDQDCFAGLDIPLAGEKSTILMNDGSGRFSEKEASGIGADFFPAANAIFADFNGDAKLDLFVGTGQTSYAAADRLYFGKGDGSFTDATVNLQGNVQRPSNGSVGCDYDDDGDVDIFVSTYGVSTLLGHNVLWENTGGAFVDVAKERGFAAQLTGNYFLSETGLGQDAEPGKGIETAVGSNGFGLDCGDINNDGYLDIFLTAISHANPADYSRLWSDPSQALINQGPEQGFSFKNEFLQRGIPFNEGDIDGALIDYDNDGWLDMSLSRESKYEKAYSSEEQKGWFGLMHQRPDGSFESVGLKSGINILEGENPASLSSCVDDSGCQAGEKCLKEKCRLPCTEDSECSFKDGQCHSGGFCKLRKTMKKAQNHAWSDIDGDGDLDLLVGGRDTGGGRPNFLFRNEIGSQNRWMSIKVEGDGELVNRDAIGTKVRIVSEEQSLFREVRSSRGMYNSMDTRMLQFGLGSMGCDYDIQVLWPNGQQAQFSSGAVPEEQRLVLKYPDELEVLEP